MSHVSIIPTDSRINPRALLAVGLLGAIIVLCITLSLTFIATESLRDELKATKAQLAKAEANARSAYSKLFDQQERFGEEVEALHSAHSVVLYQTQQRCAVTN